ncbi:MAG: hypothetical protein IJO18_05175, partial [Alphaproteobacteria bacterium]|nr:hypothetical protein [Alphaproteobacteria bacterium]
MLVDSVSGLISETTKKPGICPVNVCCVVKLFLPLPKSSGRRIVRSVSMIHGISVFHIQTACTTIPR